MNTDLLWVRQGRGITLDEWRLQWRSWGTWLVGLFLLAVVLSEHPVFSWAVFSTTQAASLWADRVSLVGSLVAILTVPFALDRVRRQRVAPIEFSKPFERSAYVVGKFIGAIFPLLVITFLSLGLHLVSTLATAQDGSLVWASSEYFKQALLIALPPLIFAASVSYSLSVFLRRPIVIIPLYLAYLIFTTATQAAADARFSWLSPVVRPEYFGHLIPEGWLPTVVLHQAIYLLFSAGLLILAVWGFQRKRFLGKDHISTLWRSFRIPSLPLPGITLRMLWGGHMIAAFLMALVAIANTMSNPQTESLRRAEYALFGLEFYLPVCGLLILAGVLARDKRVGALDLVLTKPVNRWRLLQKRLLPAMAIYIVVCVIAVGLLHFAYEPLPLFKALLVSISTGIYLGVLGMTVANVFRSPLAGYGAGIVYWFLEAAFDGRFTAPFYLLIVSNQVHGAAGEAWRNPAIWLPVKLGIAILAVWLFLLNGWLLDAGVARRRALVVLGVSIPAIFLAGWRFIPLLI